MIMNTLRYTLYIVICMLSCAACASGTGSKTGHPRLLVSAEQVERNATTWQDTDQFAATLATVRARVDAYFQTAPDVPQPRDAGGGYTHEQHKRNALAINDAGMLYLWTGKTEYAQHATDLLLAYAKLYPTLGEHPKKKEQTPGQLFWQSLNESVWLVYVIQGYDAIYDAISPQHRADIENKLLRPMALYLSIGQPQTFDKIHNHGTWATAAVGMTGYVLDDNDYVNKALLGLKQDGSAGFLKQLEELFSPDGYYNEGPYYQRYALMPFVLFAKSIQQNEPERQIFKYRDNILQKAIYTAIQLSYAGTFFPINDAIKDKGLDTVELDYAIPIAYGLTGDESLLSLIDENSNLVLTGDGLALARARADGRAKPFIFASTHLRDGTRGDRGALTILRDTYMPGHTAVLFKATAQGLGHGHFDRLNWLYYDNGTEVVTDYGAARFLNVVQKNGGHYLPENTSWAKQTVAHNTLVVDETSHYDGKFERGELVSPDAHFYAVDDDIQIVSSRETGAYPGVEFDRTIAMINSDLDRPLVIDVLRVRGKQPHRYDLPLYYHGQMIATSKPLVAATTGLSPVGAGNGYQHLWQLARTEVTNDQPFAFTWILGNRFYTYSVLADAPIEVLMTEVGANDPELNLRHEPGLLFRATDTAELTFVNVMEAHGEYNGAREFTLRSGSQVAGLRRFSSNGNDLIEIDTVGGDHIRLALSYDLRPQKKHTINTPAGKVQWTGFYQLQTK